MACTITRKTTISMESRFLDDLETSRSSKLRAIGHLAMWRLGAMVCHTVDIHAADDGRIAATYRSIDGAGVKVVLGLRSGKGRYEFHEQS